MLRGANALGLGRKLEWPEGRRAGTQSATQKGPGSGRRLSGFRSSMVPPLPLSELGGLQLSLGRAEPAGPRRAD